MAPHSSTLAWKIPWTEEPGRLQSMGLQRVGHDLMTKQLQDQRCWGNFQNNFKAQAIVLINFSALL